MEFVILEIFYYSSILSYLVSVVLLYRFRSRFETSVFKLLFSLQVVCVATDLLNTFLSRTFHIYSCYTFSIYNFIAGLLILSLYHHIFNHTWLKRLTRLFVIVYTLIGGYNIFLVYTGIDINTEIAHIWLSVFIVLLSIAYFLSTLYSPGYEPVERIPFFWINGAFLILYGGTFFLWIFSRYIASENSGFSLYIYLWPIQNIATILYNGLIVRSTLIKPRFTLDNK